MSCIQYAASIGKGILWLLNALSPFAWPSVFLIAFFALRTPLSEFAMELKSVLRDKIAELKRVKFRDYEAQFEQGHIQATGKERQPTTEKPEGLPATVESAPFKASDPEKMVPDYARPYYDKILADMRVFENASPQYREHVLAVALASTQVELHFERVYKDIFGTQIDALFYLGKHDEGSLLKFWLTHQERVKETGAEYPPLTQPNWYAYLINNGLITFFTDTCKLTPLGRAFLTFLGNRGYMADQRLF